MNSNLKSNKFTNVNFAEWLPSSNEGNKFLILVAVSGYESRCVTWMKSVYEKSPPAQNSKYLVFGFNEYNDALNRAENDLFYDQRNIPIIKIGSEQHDSLIGKIEKEYRDIKEMAGISSVEIHIDYSCMPRNWYCNLPKFLTGLLKENDKAFFWYTSGNYPEHDYPTAGVEDFKVFSGQANMSPAFRTHIFGLGFDRIRSQAIWSVLDPQNLICFYTDPGVIDGYVDRVKEENKDILRAANHHFTVPYFDFEYTLSKINSVVREFREIGDVILVPDGPKPLVLATSIIPYLNTQPGIVCFHVNRRKGLEFKPVDVKPVGQPYGFYFNGVDVKNQNE